MVQDVFMKVLVSAASKCSGAIRPHSIVLLVFAVGALLFLASVLREGGHPRALEAELVACEVLDEPVWAILPFATDGGIIRSPASAKEQPNWCALELDPVPAGDRFGRIARGDDADRVRQIASVMIMTRAALWRQSPTASVADFTKAWSAELVADGISGEPLEGPWESARLMVGSRGQQAILIEDDGIMVWITADDVKPELMLTFAGNVANRLKEVP